MRVDTFCPGELLHEWSSGKEFSIGSIKNVKKAVAIRFDEKLSWLPPILRIDKNRGLNAVVVVEIVRSELEIPFQFPGVRIDCEHSRSVEIVSGADAAVVVGRSVARAPVDGIQLR